MVYYELLEKAKAIGGIVYKTRFNCFQICKSLWSLALLVIRQPRNICYYEIVTNQQTTYLDLDLKVEDCKMLPPGLIVDRRNMAKQCIQLLEWGYEKYLGLKLDRSHVTLGDGSGPDKISQHVIVYDEIHSWETGLAKDHPYCSSQKHFIYLLRNESQANSDKQDCLTYTDRETSRISSVIDIAPYNSKGSQAFRTLFSAKVGISR